jgi:hypothetical protein
MSAFVPCSQCQRHVRSDEAVCPFCGGTLPLSIVPRTQPKARLGRAATFAFGAAVAASTTIACGDDTSPGVDSGPGTRDSGTSMVDSGGVTEDAGSTSMDGGSTSMDGGSTTMDSGSSSMQDSGTDAGEGMVMPLYGAMPSPE